MAVIFTYGTLTYPEILSTILGKSFKNTEYELKNYQRFLVKDQVFPGAIAQVGASIHGRLYEDIDPHSMKILDIFESDIYHRQKIDGYDCYLVSDDKHNLLTDTIWQPEIFEQRYYQDYLNRCKSFHDYIKRKIDL